MSEIVASVVSIFSAVDQGVMLDRLAESPLEDAEVGFLTDRDASGRREVSHSLLAGIRIFSGLSPNDDQAPASSLEQADSGPETLAVLKTGEDARTSFIMFGPSGQNASTG